LILPACNTEAMNLHLVEIAKTVAPGAHAVLMVDQAGWHMSTRLVVPPNITIIALPPKSPELNPVETSGRPYVRCQCGCVHVMRRARVASDGPAPSLTHRGRAMQQNIRLFVGLDTSKMRISVALAEEGRQGEVRFLGEIENTPDAIKRLANKLTGKFQQLLFCYEAGPTGYGLHRQITALGHDCSVIAPSLIPKRPGEHVKTNRRDALTLARLHRAGELTTIWVPDPGHEAIRDLVRAREAAMEDLRAKRQHLQSFLLRHGRIYPGLRSWTLVHARWLSSLTFEHSAQYLVLREYRQAIEDAEARLERLTQQVADVVSTWSMAPVVEAYQAMRGVAFLTAVTFVAEIGDVRRFETPRQLMAYLGLVPSERSTGEQVRRGGITKAGKPKSPPGPNRRCLDLSLSGSPESTSAGATGDPPQDRADYCLEGSGAAVCTLSQINCSWQTPVLGNDSDCTRDGCLPVGDRSRGGAARRRNMRSNETSFVAEGPINFH